MDNTADIQVADVQKEDINDNDNEIIKNKKTNNFIYYLLAFLIPVVCLIIHMIIKGCYPFGDNTILLGDSNAQYLGFFREWLEQIEDGGSFFFDWNGGLGYEFYTTYWYYLASPFNWIVLLLGHKYVELGMVISLLLQIGGCGVTACYYFTHSKINKMEKGVSNNLLCVLFSLAFSVCNFILINQYNMIWLTSLLFMPLVLLGIEKLVDNKDGRLYGISLFLVFVTNFYFAWFICLFAIVWFIDQKKDNIKSGLKSFVHFAGMSALSAMCAAAVLIPCYFFVLGRNDNWIDFSDYAINTFGNIGDFFQGFFWGNEIELNASYMFTYNYYCGIFVLFLAIAYCFVKGIDLKQKIKRIVEIVFLAFSLNWVVTIYIFHGFSFPHGFSGRFLFIMTFILIVTAFEALQRTNTVRIRFLALEILIFAPMFAVVLLFNDNVQNIWCYLGSILIFAYLCLCLFFLKRKSIKGKSFLVNILIIGFVELISNTFFIRTDHYEVSKENAIYAEDWSGNYYNIETDAGERKTSWMSDTNCFQFSDTDIFSSVINSDLLWFFEDIGLTYQNNGGTYAYRGTTPLTAALFNVDYVLTDEDTYFGGYDLEESYSFESTDGDYGLYTTAYDSELGFMLPESVLEWNTDDDNPFEVQNNFTRDVLNQGDIFTKIEFEDVQVNNANCVITDISDDKYSYINYDLTDSGFAIIELSFTVDEDMHLYVYTGDEECQVAISGMIDDEKFVSGSYVSPGVLADIGELNEGQNVVLDLIVYCDTLYEGTAYIDFYTYNDEVMQDCLSIMNESPLVLDTFEDAYVSGTVTAKEDGVLYTSIPYYKGWTLYVDGEETEITKIADSLVGVELSAGEHTIELKYFPYGLKVGIIITIIGIFGMCMYFVIFKRKNKQ